MRRILLLLAGLLAAPAPALASICHTFVEGAPGVRLAALDALVATAPEVRFLYVGHSTYRIETPAGVAINTDYFGADGPGGLPDVVTMNHAHETHFTDRPDPAIGHVLRGWNPAGAGPAEHLVTVADVTIRNVTTDIRGWGAPEKDGNSIFVFEVADLCIGHLGHLHHEPTEEQYAALGRLDVLMVPVDGSYTLALPQMIGVAKRLRARLVLPMHYFGLGSLERFLAGMSDEFAIESHPGPVLAVAADRLPARPTVVVMRATGHAHD